MPDNVQQIIQEAYRLSEKSLDEDARFALAADQRAMSFCGLCLTAAAILTGLYDNTSPSLGLLAGAAILVIAGLVAGLAARPVVFFAAGTAFQKFKSDIDQGRNYHEVMAQMATYNDTNSKSNRKKIQSNANLLYGSFFIAVVGLIVPILFAFLCL